MTYLFYQYSSLQFVQVTVSGCKINQNSRFVSVKFKKKKKSKKLLLGDDETCDLILPYTVASRHWTWFYLNGHRRFHPNSEVYISVSSNKKLCEFFHKKSARICLCVLL